MIAKDADKNVCKSGIYARRMTRSAGLELNEAVTLIAVKHIVVSRIRPGLFNALANGVLGRPHRRYRIKFGSH